MPPVCPVPPASDCQAQVPLGLTTTHPRLSKKPLVPDDQSVWSPGSLGREGGGLS